MPPPSERIPFGAALALLVVGAVTLIGVTSAFKVLPRVAHAEKATPPPQPPVPAPAPDAPGATPPKRGRRPPPGPEDLSGFTGVDDALLLP
jgi:hypothetical protein